MIDDTRSTGEVARDLTAQLGRRVTEREIQGVLRRTGAGAITPPPLVAGRRAWREEDVQALLDVLDVRAPRRARRAR